MFLLGLSTNFILENKPHFIPLSHTIFKRQRLAYELIIAIIPPMRRHLLSFIILICLPLSILGLSISTTELVKTDYQTKLANVIGNDQYFITQQTYTYGPTKFQQLCRSFDMDGKEIGTRTLSLNEVLGGLSLKNNQVFTLSGDFQTTNAFYSTHANKVSLLIKPSTVSGHKPTGNFTVRTYPLSFSKGTIAFNFDVETNKIYDIGYVPNTTTLYMTTGIHTEPTANRNRTLPPKVETLTLLDGKTPTIPLPSNTQYISWISNGSRLITNQGTVLDVTGNIVTSFNRITELEWDEKQIFTNPKTDIVYVVYPSGNAQVITAWNTLDNSETSFELQGLDKLYLSPDKSNFAQGYVSNDGQHFAIFDLGKCFLVNLNAASIYPLFYSLSSQYNRYQFNTPIEDVMFDETNHDLTVIIRDLRNDQLENIELSIYNEFGFKRDSYRIKKGRYYPVKDKKCLQEIKYNSINLIELRPETGQ